MSHPRFSKATLRPRRLARRAKRAVVGTVVDGALWALGRLSLEQALACGEKLGAVLYRVLRRPRRLALEHLRLVFGREISSSSRQILAALDRNALLAMLIDQDTHPSVSVPVLGRVAGTSGGAAAIAIRRELPAVAVFMQRRPTGGHRITVSPPFVVERSGDARADIHALSTQFNLALDAQVRKNPAECMWWQRRRRAAPD